MKITKYHPRAARSPKGSTKRYYGEVDHVTYTITENSDGSWVWLASTGGGSYGHDSQADAVAALPGKDASLAMYDSLDEAQMIADRLAAERLAR